MESHKCEFAFNGEGLKTLVKETNLSENTIAEEIGISIISFKKYLNGTVPTTDNLMKIADYFAVPLDFLMCRCTEEQTKSILDDYVTAFKESKRIRYEAYLEKYGATLTYSKQCNIHNKPEAPYPYNLFDAINEKPVDFILGQHNINGLEWALTQLTERENTVLTMFYKEDKNESEIGKIFDVTRDRIRVIRLKGVSKLKHPHLKNVIFGGLYKPEDIENYTLTHKLYLDRCENLDKRENALKEKETELYQMKHQLSETENKLTAVIEKLYELSLGRNTDGRIKNVIKPFLFYIDQTKINMNASIADILDIRTYNILSKQGFKTSGDIISELRCNPEFYMFKNIKGLGNISYMDMIYDLDAYFGVTIFFKTYILPEDIELFKKYVSSNHPYAYGEKVLLSKEKYDFLTEYDFLTHFV